MLSINNEWDQLRSVVVGIADYANWPSDDTIFSKEHQKTTWTETPVPSGPVPQRIIDETNEDLHLLCEVLVKHGVEVTRPETMNFQKLGGMYNYCPRDRLLIVGDIIIDPAMMYPCRDMEYRCYLEVLIQSRQILNMPRNQGLVLDAANVCHIGPKKLLYLESPSGNRQAYHWLLANLSPDISIELCNFYSGVHIDSTVVPLREGLVLLNGSRVNDENCPLGFKDWEKIYVQDVVAQDFYQYPYASKWIGLNMLSINPNTVIVDKNQADIISMLEKKNFTVIPLELRHSRTLGGGFHCVTLDLVRDSNK